MRTAAVPASFAAATAIARRSRSSSECVINPRCRLLPSRLRGPALTRSNRVALLDRHDEHAAVAELPRARVIDDRLNDVVDQVVRSDHVDHAHREESLVLDAATVSYRPGPPPTPAHLGHREP